MRLSHSLAPAALLAFAIGVSAQTTPPAGPTTGGSAPTTTAPTTGGVGSARAQLIFPTDPAATARAAAGVSPSSMFPTQVTTLSGVPAALNLTDRQRIQLDTLTQQLQSRFQPQFDRVPILPAADQDARRQELNREYLAAWLNGASGVFTDAQLARFQQLQLQFGGFTALNDPVAQKALSLTGAQQAMLKQDIAWSNQQEAAIQQAAQTNQARAVELFNAFNAASQTRLNQLLNPTQQQAWAQLTGSPFAFQPTFQSTGATGASPAVTSGPGGVVFPGTTTTGGTVMPAGPTTGTSGGVVMPGSFTVPGRTGPGNRLNPTFTPATSGGLLMPGTTTVPGRTGPGGAPLPTSPAPIGPGNPGPTTGGTTPGPTGPTTGGPAPPKM